jgi:hypothetical protein
MLIVIFTLSKLFIKTMSKGQQIRAFQFLDALTANGFVCFLG